MNTAEAYAKLLKAKSPVIETNEAADVLGLSHSRTSHLMRAFQDAGLATKVWHGLWALGYDKPDEVTIPPYLTAPFPAYISLWSALARHEMIEQVPRQTHVASLSRTKTFATKNLGTFEIHHIAPEVFGGFEGGADTGYFARPEKALFDTVYTRAPKGSGIYLPELSLPRDFDHDQLRHWVNRISSQRIQTIVSSALDRLISTARPADE